MAQTTGVPIGRTLKNRELPYILMSRVINNDVLRFMSSQIWHSSLDGVYVSCYVSEKRKKNCKPNASLSIHAVYHVHFNVKYSDSPIIIEIIQ